MGRSGGPDLGVRRGVEKIDFTNRAFGARDGVGLCFRDILCIRKCTRRGLVEFGRETREFEAKMFQKRPKSIPGYSGLSDSPEIFGGV